MFSSVGGKNAPQGPSYNGFQSPQLNNEQAEICTFHRVGSILFQISGK